LFERVILPSAVRDELATPKAPLLQVSKDLRSTAITLL
jgi:hypothetical protein